MNDHHMPYESIDGSWLSIEAFSSTIEMTELEYNSVQPVQDAEDKVKCKICGSVLALRSARHHFIVQHEMHVKIVGTC
jgi:hypothetical protein